MPSATHNLGNPEDGGSFNDSELTPKPLRITKRGNRRTSDILNISRKLSSSSSQRTLVPTRTSSISSSRIRLDVPSQNLISGVSRTRRHLSLQPDKHCRGQCVGTSTAVKTIASQFPTTHGFPRNQSAANMVNDISEHSLVKGNVSVAVRPLTTRAFSTGSFKKSYFLSPINDEETIPRSPTPLVTQRRAVTENVPLHRHFEAKEQSYTHDHLLRRQPSFRKGLISRVMSGLTHRTHSSQATALNREQSMHRTDTKMSDLRTKGPETMGHLGRTSESSGEVDLSTNSPIQSALAAFPTPPTSSGTSSRGSDPLPSFQAEPQPYRNLPQPGKATIMGAELRLTAERDELDSECGDSMLVAIDIAGTLNLTAKEQNLWSQHTGLDVVVIIDNSFYTSPSMLMASCETTRAIAATLNHVTDRLAVLCTSPLNDHRTLGSNFATIWPLSSIKAHKLKAVLDAVANTKEKPTHSTWESTIKVATNTLLQSHVPDPDLETLQDTFGIVIVLTANAEGLSPGLLEHEQIQFHVVCPSSVPRKGFHTIECNGWNLRSMSGQAPQAVRAPKDSDPNSLLNRLRRLIIHARGGKDAGRLTYLSLDIKPGPGCCIESLMGKTDYLTLHPGELRTVLVRLRVRSLSSRGNTLSSTTTLPNMGPDSTDILSEIDRMLKGASRPLRIMTARLKYQHTLLPKGTTCSISAECKVRKQISRPVPEMYTGMVDMQRKPECTALVHERLAYYLATHGSPTHALSSFREEFGDEGWRSGSPEYTHLVFNELKYQARMVERLEIDASPKKPLLPITVNTDRSRSRDPENIGETPSGCENHRHESWIDDHDEDVHDPQFGHTTLSEDGLKTVKSIEQIRGVDEEDAFWVKRRSKSHHPNKSVKERAVSSKQEAERRKNIRHKIRTSHPVALSKKKKSRVGAFAMRRIISVGEGMGKGLGGI